MRYYEDFTVGDTFTFDPVRVEKSDITTFAEQYDPLPLHTDETATMGAPFDGVIASGIHTLAVSQQQVATLYDQTHLVAGLGFERLAFPAPVYPGDELTTTLTIDGKRPYERDTTRGVITTNRTVVNQHDETVMRTTGEVLFERTPDS